MKRIAPLDFSLLLSLAGAGTGICGLWLGGGQLGFLVVPGLIAVYLAAGLPAAGRALMALWREHVLDIDLLMVVAALAAALVGAPSRVRCCWVCSVPPARSRSGRLAGHGMRSRR